MTSKSPLVQDARIIDVLKRFRGGTIDMEAAAQEIIKHKDWHGLSLSPDDLELLSPYISGAVLSVVNINMSETQRGHAQLDVRFAVSRVCAKRA